MSVLFESIRTHARTYEYPGPSVVALESVLIRLYLESPVGGGPPLPGMPMPMPGPPTNGQVQMQAPPPPPQNGNVAGSTGAVLHNGNANTDATANGAEEDANGEDDDENGMSDDAE
jgi:hypothetical protein